MIWRRGQAYSQDLRDRVLAAVDGGLPVSAAAPLFRVSVSYIYKALGRRRRTGETSARPQRSHTPPKLAGYDEAIRTKVRAEPDATLDELRTWLREKHDLSISRSGLWTRLARLGLTLKKRRVTPPNRTVPTSPARGTRGAGASRPSIPPS